MNLLQLNLQRQTLEENLPLKLKKELPEKSKILDKERVI